MKILSRILIVLSFLIFTGCAEYRKAVEVTELKSDLKKYRVQLKELDSLLRRPDLTQADIRKLLNNRKSEVFIQIAFTLEQLRSLQQ